MCYPYTVCKCTNKSNCNPSTSDNVNYTGPTLSCIGINTNDNLTVVLQKINTIVCGLLPTTTTTSTTIPPTTTTTTTVTASFYGFNFASGNVSSSTACSSSTYLTVEYSNVPILADGVIMYSDTALTFPMNGGNNYYKTAAGNTVWRINSSGVIVSHIVCP